MMDDDKVATTGPGPFVDAVQRDPSAKRISDFATSPPAKDISAIKAASDLFEAEEADEAAEAEKGRKTEKSEQD